MSKTIFEKIINREIPADIVFENERIIVIKDIAPVAPVHLLIISKKPIMGMQFLEKQDLPLVGEMIQVGQKLAKEFQITDGYRLIINNGREAGQTIFHLHFHLIGGRPLGIMG
jgi:histidine triad (HIT) family protein